MGDIPKNNRFQGLRWLAAGFLFLSAVLFVTSSLLPTLVARFALARLVPAHTPSLGSATLAPAGRLVLHDLLLHDTGALARQPLLTVREVKAVFEWADVLSRQIRWVRAEEAIVYARLSGPSPLSLLGLFIDHSSPGPTTKAPRNLSPLWIDTVNVGGLFHLEAGKGFAPASAEWPLTLQMTTSGDRLDPVRRFRVAVGEVRPVPGKIAEPPTSTASASARSATDGFSLWADFDTRSVAETTRVGVHQLAAGPVVLKTAADTVHQHAPNLPVELSGPLSINFRALNLSGLVGVGPEESIEFNGQLRLQDLRVHLPVGGNSALVLDRLTVAGHVKSRLDRWTPATLRVRQGVLHWAALSYGNQAVHNLKTDWRIDDQKLRTERGTAQIFGGHIRGSLTWDLTTHAMPQCDFQLKNIDMHEALANLSPQHLDAEGRASGVLRLVRSPAGELSGAMELTFDEPGVLRVGEIAAVRRMLVGNVGLELARLAMHELQQYPFKEGRIYLESVGENSQLKINFIRQPSAHTEEKPPRKEIVNGQETRVRSLVVPRIDLTIPIKGTSLATILSWVGGVHPLIEARREQQGK